MTKKIQYREPSSDEWKTLVAADVQAASENHTHIFNDINGVLPVDKGGTGQNTKENAPFVVKETTNITNDGKEALTTARIDANWKSTSQPIRIWTHSDYQDIDGDYGFIVSKNEPCLYNWKASPQTIWTGLTTKNVQWERISAVRQFTLTSPDAEIMSIYRNDKLKLIYLKIWFESSHLFKLTPGDGILSFSTNTNVIPIRDSSIPGYKNDITGYGNNFGYYIGAGQTIRYINDQAVNSDLNLYYCTHTNNNTIWIRPTSTQDNISVLKFQTMIPYDSVGIK